MGAYIRRREYDLGLFGRTIGLSAPPGRLPFGFKVGQGRRPRSRISSQVAFSLRGWAERRWAL
jgi:hypothetical protein